MGDVKHGSRWTYTRHGCRCPACTEALRVDCLRYRRNRGDRPIEVYQADRKRQAAERRARIGNPDEALIRRAAELERAREQARGELAAVVAEQVKDEQDGPVIYSHLVSLDARDVYGRERYETVRVAA